MQKKIVSTFYGLVSCWSLREYCEESTAEVYNKFSWYMTANAMPGCVVSIEQESGTKEPLKAPINKSRLFKWLGFGFSFNFT